MNQIIFGDCSEELTKIPNQSIDMIVTDPPYFLPINSYVGTMEKGYEHRTLADTSILKSYFKSIFKEFARVIKPEGIWYIFCDGQSYPIFYECAFPFCKSVRPLIWDKGTSVFGYTWRHQHELILMASFESTERIPTGEGDVLRCNGVRQKDRNHPAEKPVELLERLISKHPKLNMILDPYCGSGSTLVACKKLNKNYIGIELDEKYQNTINERLNNLKTLEVFCNTITQESQS